MPSKKQEIRKQVKKKLKKEGMEHQELNQEAEIVDLGDRRGDDIIVESLTILRQMQNHYHSLQHLRKRKKELLAVLRVFSHRTVQFYVN